MFSDVKKEVRCLRTVRMFCLIFSLVCITALTGLLWQSYSQMCFARRVADEVLRFHVIANSDSAEDQALKLAVRDALISWMACYGDSFTDAAQATSFVEEHRDELLSLANSVIRAEGYDYQVQANVTHCDFPDKTYGSYTFPAGEYEALRVEIGQAQGQNWWCVLYPPLCFTEEGGASFCESSEEQLESLLTEEDFARLKDPDAAAAPRIRFYLFDWLFGR
jgi:stage II sporulation protein R